MCGMRISKNGQETYRYYAIRQPVSLGAIPKGPGISVQQVIDYDVDWRIPIKGETFSAWGEVTYADPLTEEQLKSYELQPSRFNPDVKGIVYMQAHAVGEWETKEHIIERKRITRWSSDHHSYLLDECHSIEELKERYELIQKYGSVMHENPYKYL